MNNQLTYRSDIDGLRGIAILAVLFFHYFHQILPAGFLGVDVFFVISGFLITRIILAEWKSPFFFRSFYYHRARRLFPALSLVLVASSIVGSIFFYDHEFQSLLDHIFAAGTFTSNFALYSETGYFDQASELKPLLHLWSLALEEQFYLLWPAVLYLILRTRFRADRLVLFLALASIIAFSLVEDKSLAFYHPLTRAWELLLGGLLAFAPSTEQNPRWPRYVGPGLLVLAFSYFPLHQVAALGTALMLINDSSFFSRRILSHKYLVFVGKISYPLYLWMWVLLCFDRIILEQEPAVEKRLLLMLLSFVLAWATVRFVERPVRRWKLSLKNSTILTAPLLVLLALSVIENRQFEGRNKFEKYFVLKEGPGKLLYEVSQPNLPPTIAIIGDSHAYHFYYGFSVEYLKRGENVLLISRYKCLPFWDLAYEAADSQNCHELINYALDYILNLKTIHTVYLAHRFEDRVVSWRGNLNVLTSYSKALEATLKRLEAAGKKVVFINSVPKLKSNPFDCLNKKLALGREPRSCTITRAEHDEEHTLMKATAEAVLLRHPSVRILKPEDYLCENQTCYGFHDGRLLYSDDNHLNGAGGLFVAKKFLADYLRK